MVVIPAGEFMMGSPEDEEGRRDNEGPQHLVTIERPFALGRYPVTFEEYDVFCEQTHRKKPEDRAWGRGRRPVINVSWKDATAYCAWLSERTSIRYRLPSEAEWEYACRAGSRAAYAFGETIDEKQANFYPNVKMTSDVGAYPANAFKLFDMHGNVWEWCLDHYQGSYEGAPADGSPLLLSEAAGDRVLRGGSWFLDARHARAASRSRNDPGERDGVSVGFRCARGQA
jgi:formylglycine-generating enzyme required for sulfatase activity